MFRIFLLIATNVAIMAMLSITVHLLGLNAWLSANGVDFVSLLLFCSLFGFGGAFVSLLLSKTLAKMSVGARVISNPSGADEAWLVSTVERFANQVGIGMPEVAVFDGPPNAFATGASRDNALVAVSTGLLQTMDRRQVEAVLGHEVAHVANGDLVTLTLVQGVVNTFVMFLARVVGFVVDRVVLRNNGRGPGIGYSLTVLVMDILLSILASIVVAWFSRRREFRADAGAAALMGTTAPMISALQALAGSAPAPLPANLKAFGIGGGSSWMALFSTHPPIHERVEALRRIGQP